MSKTDEPKTTILVVDDVGDTRITLKAFLEHRHYHVVEAINGQQAVEVAVRERPQLILMDLFMPLQDGITATRAIREHAELRDVPIVAVSAYGTLGILHHDALAAGCNDYVTKPLDFDQLGYLIDRLLKTGAGEAETSKEAARPTGAKPGPDGLDLRREEIASGDAPVQQACEGGAVFCCPNCGAPLGAVCGNELTVGAVIIRDRVGLTCVACSQASEWNPPSHEQ